MAELILSDAQKSYVINSIRKNVRLDGRTNEEFRCMELETDVIISCHGSARLTLGGTDILCGVKAEICDTKLGKPDEGYLNFSVFCSAIAAPDFEGRGGESLEESLSSLLTSAYDKSVDLSKLSVLSGKKCWCLYVDVLILGVGGNLCDTASIAVKAALHNTRIPNLVIMKGEGGDGDYEVPEDPSDCFSLDTANIPCLITVNKISDFYIVDATLEEEACVTTRITLGITKDGIVTVTNQQVPVCVNIFSSQEMTQIARKLGKSLDKELMEALKKEESCQGSVGDVKGFLR